jgi:two-component system, cell cycle response regulator
LSLQRRLTLFFVLIVILPLAAAGFVVQRVVVSEIARRAVLSLGPSLDASVVLYNDRVGSVDERVRAAVENARVSKLVAEGKKQALSSELDRIVGRVPGVDFLGVLDSQGRVVGFAAEAGGFLGDTSQPDAGSISQSAPGTQLLFHRTQDIPVRIPKEGLVGRVFGGFWLDEGLLVASTSQRIDLSIASGGQIVASTAEIDRPVPTDVDFRDPFDVDIGGGGTGQARELRNGVALIASTPKGPIDDLANTIRSSMIGLLAIAFIATALLAYVLARSITQPLYELSEGARAIAEGRFDYRIPTGSRDEVGRLAAVFNDMTGRLQTTVSQLYTSRDRLQRAVRLVGETLRSTHDMKQMLGSILKTATDAVQADAAVLWMLTPSRNELTPASATGVDVEALGRIDIGQGIAGHVAERAGTVHMTGEGQGPRPTKGEPQYPVVVAVPIFTNDRVKGVIATYRADESMPFTREDRETVMFLAEQGGVAIENVLLHEEAQRLSLTDGLTGVWNRRYFQMQFRQVQATATRFDRRFSIVMLDLDHFKKVNDTHGHQRGDAILIEFARRVNSVLREVDTFARYGGEEFIGLLSETDLQGAVTTAEKIHEGIKAEPFGDVGEEPIWLTVSVGVAVFPEHGDSYASMVEAADRAMYRAKQEGRDKVVVAEPFDPSARPQPDLKIAK